jgi:hypothetical protein
MGSLSVKLRSTASSRWYAREYGAYWQGIWTSLINCRLVHHKCHMVWPGREPGPPRWETNELITRGSYAISITQSKRSVNKMGARKLLWKKTITRFARVCILHQTSHWTRDICVLLQRAAWLRSFTRHPTHLLLSLRHLRNHDVILHVQAQHST